MPSKFRPRDARYVEGKGAIRRASEVVNERVSRSGEEETFAQEAERMRHLHSCFEVLRR